jgi:hypothetical protein
VSSEPHARNNIPSGIETSHPDTYKKPFLGEFQIVWFASFGMCYSQKYS